MHACRSVSAACRPAQTRRRRGEIGGIPRWILVGRIRPNGRKRVIQHDRRSSCLSLLRPQPFQKPLEVIGSPTYVLACQEPTAPDSDINQTAGSPGRPSMWKNRCMHAAVCLLHAGQLKHAVDEAKSGEFLGEFSWVEFDPMGVRGLLCNCLSKGI